MSTFQNLRGYWKIPADKKQSVFFISYIRNQSRMRQVAMKFGPCKEIVQKIVHCRMFLQRTAIISSAGQIQRPFHMVSAPSYSVSLGMRTWNSYPNSQCNQRRKLHKTQKTCVECTGCSLRWHVVNQWHFYWKCSWCSCVDTPRNRQERFPRKRMNNQFMPGMELSVMSRTDIKVFQSWGGWKVSQYFRADKRRLRYSSYLQHGWN